MSYSNLCRKLRCWTKFPLFCWGFPHGMLAQIGHTTDCLSLLWLLFTCCNNPLLSKFLWLHKGQVNVDRFLVSGQGWEVGATGEKEWSVIRAQDDLCSLNLDMENCLLQPEQIPLLWKICLWISLARCFSSTSKLDRHTGHVEDPEIFSQEFKQLLQNLKWDRKRSASHKLKIYSGCAEGQVFHIQFAKLKSNCVSRIC